MSTTHQGGQDAVFNEQPAIVDDGCESIRDVLAEGGVRLNRDHDIGLFEIIRNIVIIPIVGAKVVNDGLLRHRAHSVECSLE